MCPVHAHQSLAFWGFVCPALASGGWATCLPLRTGRGPPRGDAGLGLPVAERGQHVQVDKIVQILSLEAVNAKISKGESDSKFPFGLC